MKTKLYLPLITLCILLGCKKDKTVKQPFITGKYVGTFNYTVAGKTEVAPAQVIFGPTNYTSIGQPNKKPAGGSGTYTFNTDSFLFTDTHPWTADFDWGLILKGNFDYEVKGDSLILTRWVQTNAGGINFILTDYKYRLKRVSNTEY
ncbi:hypothetical protein [Pedobacter nototheniae]|uniref:hypothetical protein n=1 Tax=Pedobacter nototheniae TaxID=2488994 RepID=UPI00103F66DA|nr:hypothetical protein [Pedobacter nototheniae]